MKRKSESRSKGRTFSDLNALSSGTNPVDATGQQPTINTQTLDELAIQAQAARIARAIEEELRNRQTLTQAI